MPGARIAHQFAVAGNDRIAEGTAGRGNNPIDRVLGRRPGSVVDAIKTRGGIAASRTPSNASSASNQASGARVS